MTKQTEMSPLHIAV
jgi:ankyrin repeat protein